MVSLKNVLVATDFGEASEVALQYGRQLARLFGATLNVLHVVDDLGARVTGFPEYASSLDRLQVETEKAARMKADRLLSDEDRQQLRAQAVVVTSLTPVHAILSYARDIQADLIIIGTHGRGAVAHLVMGSVAERVVRGAPCPVLTVHYPEREFVLPDALQTVATA
jgi:nucleotide-binding universal stress UspA family protein